MQIPFRRLSKKTLNLAVGSAAYAVVYTQLTEHTELEEGSFAVDFASGATSAVVVVTTKKHTDALVDNIADKLEERKLRKTNPEIEKIL